MCDIIFYSFFFIGKVVVELIQSVKNCCSDWSYKDGSIVPLLLYTSGLDEGEGHSKSAAISLCAHVCI